MSGGMAVSDPLPRHPSFFAYVKYRKIILRYLRVRNSKSEKKPKDEKKIISRNLVLPKFKHLFHQA